MAKAFSGLRVVDFSQVFAGPFCTHQLAVLGADVIKIEEPKLGDQARGIVADNDIGRIGMALTQREIVRAPQTALILPATIAVEQSA